MGKMRKTIETNYKFILSLFHFKERKRENIGDGLKEISRKEKKRYFTI